MGACTLCALIKGNSKIHFSLSPARIVCKLASDSLCSLFLPLLQMTQRVHDLIAHEMQITGLPSHCILLAGFGEGGALALHAGLCYSKPLAGVLSVAGYLALPQRYPQHIHDAQRSTRVLAVHGASDTIVPLPFAKHRYAALQQPSGPNLPFDLRTEWSMGHFVTNTAMMATQGWITDAFKKAEQAAQQQQQKASA